MEKLHCIGCGSIIQSDDTTKPGYVPKSKLTEENEDIICRRCFRLKNYNEVTPLKISSDEYLKIIGEIGNKKAMIVMIIDIFDIEGSLITQIPKLTNHNDLIIIANKTDLLPKSLKEPKMLHHLKKIIADNEIKPLAIYLMSAAKYKNIDYIIDEIVDRAKGKDIYIVGATNVGKSTFINTLLKSYADSKKDIITVSFFAGTTLNLIKIPFGNDFIIDTPGLINENQITHYLSTKALKVVTPKKEIKPKVFQLDSKQTLFFGGLARIDFLEGEKTSFVCYNSEFIKIHRTKLEKADDLYNRQIKVLLTPPFEEDDDFPLKGHSFNIKTNNKQDIVLPGLGFVTVSGRIKIKVYTRSNTTPYIREALIWH